MTTKYDRLLALNDTYVSINNIITLTKYLTEMLDTRIFCDDGYEVKSFTASIKEDKGDSITIYTVSAYEESGAYDLSVRGELVVDWSIGSVTGKLNEKYDGDSYSITYLYTFFPELAVDPILGG
jgi:hypothetical protein